MRRMRILQIIILVLVLCAPAGSSNMRGARARSMVKTPLAYSPPTGAWRTECVDCPHRFSPNMNGRSLRLDDAGNVHIAYGGDNLYHAWFDGASWNTEIADSTPKTGKRSSLDLDLGGRPHIAYTLYMTGGHQLRYAYKDAGGWHIQTVALSWQEFGDLSLAISTDYHVHIVYDQDNALQYAYQDAGGWHFQTLDKVYTGRFPSLTLDAANFPHVSYYDYDAYQLRYAYQDAEGWHIQVVDAGGIGSSLALDEDGCAHISYLDDTSDTVRYARQENCPASSSWHFETLGPIGRANEYTSLVLDDENHPHITYMNETGGSLNYVFQDAGGWHSQPLASGGGGASLGLTADGIAHIAYVDYPYLYDIHQEDSAWVQVQVDRSAVITGSSLAMDPQGRLHVAYFKDPELIYAAQAHNEWQRQALPIVSYEFFGMAVDSQGYPHTCHYDDGLSYTFMDAGGWHTEVLDPGGALEPCYIAIDRQDYPHIIYFHTLIDESLYYAYQDAGGWHKTSLSVFGSGRDLVLDAEDYPHILFENDSLTYLQQDENGWSQTTIISGDFNHYAALALDADGYAHISYYVYPAHDLRYTYQDAGGWHSETVDSAGDTGSYTDIAIDAQGHPHISYQDIVNPNLTGNLKYAYLDEDGWHLQTVDTTFSTGFSTSIVLDEAGHPYIAYHNNATSDLMLADMLPETLYLPLALNNY